MLGCYCFFYKWDSSKAYFLYSILWRIRSARVYKFFEFISVGYSVFDGTIYGMSSSLGGEFRSICNRGLSTGGLVFSMTETLGKGLKLKKDF